jgi:hypothetical protein
MEKNLFLPKENGSIKNVKLFADGKELPKGSYTLYKRKIKFWSAPKKKQSIVVFFTKDDVPKFYYDIRL